MRDNEYRPDHLPNSDYASVLTGVKDLEEAQSSVSCVL